MRALSIVIVVGIASVTHADAKPTHCGADAAPFAIKLAARPDKSDPVLALDGELKNYLAMTFPAGLELDPNNKARYQRDLKRFTDWLAARTKASQQLVAKYGDIFTSGTNEQKIEVAARLGQVAEDFAHVLATAEIPANARRGEFAADATKAYCDAITEQAAPLFGAATERYKKCSDLAKEQSISNDWTAWCGARLAILAPAKP